MIRSLSPHSFRATGGYGDTAARWGDSFHALAAPTLCGAVLTEALSFAFGALGFGIDIASRA